MRSARVAWLSLCAWAAAAGVAGAQRREGFDHGKHARLFPTCTTCHAGATDEAAAVWPEPAACAACHDGVTRPRVSWTPPVEPRRSNLRFAHELVPIMIGPGQTEPPGCMDCHAEVGAPWMAVGPPVPERCLDCHGVRGPHVAAADTACGSCHVSLVRAASLTAADVAEFPAPPSHRAAGFARGSGHGAAATAGPDVVATSCATCHARDFCLSCHVDAPEQPAIQALDPDPRSLAIRVRLRPPPSHADPAFLSRHGSRVREAPRDCRTCHTQESCAACHTGTSRVAAALFPAGPGRAVGARPGRGRPPSHLESFAERHAVEAAAVSATCAGCHVRADCLDCHRPNAGAGPGYHPAGFLARHPAAAYARETSCAECHNAGAFCADCHRQAGITPGRALGSGYHDGASRFLLGHGQAARQSLESCVACHAERDCLSCHSARGGRHFNPHGPGFDAARMRRKNPEVCTACHGSAIPDS